jgi:uncharacterized protein YlxP (DUF503 family)
MKTREKLLLQNSSLLPETDSFSLSAISISLVSISRAQMENVLKLVQNLSEK